jgi:hypothetical protein
MGEYMENMTQNQIEAGLNNEVENYIISNPLGFLDRMKNCLNCKNGRRYWSELHNMFLYGCVLSLNNKNWQEDCEDMDYFYWKIK